MKKRRKGNLLKRMIAVLLSVVMIVEMSQDAGSINVLAAEAAAQADLPVSGTDWTLDADGKLTIVSDKGMADWCSKRNSFMHPYQEQVISIELQNVTSIEEYAFKECSNLKEITIPSGVTSIGVFAFSDCRSLKEIAIPFGVTDIGVFAFSYCSSLKEIAIPFGVTDIGDSVFVGCSNLTGIEIPSSVTGIGTQAFNGCSSLKEITIPSSVTSIGVMAFNGCSSLISMDIPSSVASIGDSAFNGCSSLTGVTIPPGVTDIGQWTFGSCSSLKEITIPSSVTSIGFDAFDGCSSLTSVTMQSTEPPTLSDFGFGNKVFVSCKFVTDQTKGINVPLESIDAYKEKWTDWADYITYNIAAGTDWTLDADGKLTIKSDEGMADWCSSGITQYREQIISVEIQGGVTSIGASAFNGCSSLTSVTMQSTEPPTLGNNAFTSCKFVTDKTKGIDVPRESMDAYKARWVIWADYITYNIVTGMDWTLDADGKLTIKSDAGMTDWCSERSDSFSHPYQGQVVSVEIQNGVTSIGYYAFYNCRNLISIDIPPSVTRIDPSALSGCSSLEEITIPSGVTSISIRAFEGCSSLISVTVQGETPPTLGYNAFTSCKFVTDQTKGINVPLESIDAYKEKWTDWADYITYNIAAGTDWMLGVDGKLTIKSDEGMADWCSMRAGSQHPYQEQVISIEIQEGVSEIGHEAFWFCTNLTSVDIPSSVTYIGYWTFAECHSLTDVTIPSGVTYIGEFAFANCKSMTSVTMQPAIPPGLGEFEVFGECKFVKDNTKGILVPAGTEDAYKRTDRWRTYQNYITDGTPEITAQPTDQSVKNGEKVTFSVTAAGAAGYQWQVNEDGTEESGFRDIANAASAIYTVSAVDKSYNGYRYRCVVTNERGSVTSNVAELTVTDSDAEKVAAAKAVVDTVLEGYTASNSSTKQDIQEKINAALTEAEITEVTVTVGELTKRDATQSEEGSLSGSVTIQCGDESDSVSIIKTIDRLPDKELPTGTITIETDSWTSFLNTITFGLFFGETKQVTIEAQDTGSGVDKIYYYVSDSALSESEIEALGEDTWTEGDSVSISPDRTCVIYAKITDKAGNTAYLSSDGLVFDETAPVISGVTDGEIYRTPQTVTVTDAYLKSVEVDGKEVALNDGQFILEAVSGEQTVSATDQAGNITAVTVTVKTEAENVSDAKTVVEEILDEMTATNATTKEEIAGAIDAALIEAGITEVTVTVGELTKKDATQSEEGSISGSVTIQCGGESDSVSIIKTIDRLPDKELPTGTITIETDSWTSFLNTITFGLFFKETKRATIEAQDTGSGVDKIYYYVSDSALSESEVKALREGAWTAGDSVSISPDRKCVIYAKITDKAGNTAYLSSDGLVFDETAPVISGVTDGEIYRTPQTVTVTDAYLKSVKVDGKEVTLNDGQFILEAVSGEQTVSATDQAGNITTVTVTVKTEAENLEDAGQIAEDTLEDMPITEDTSCAEIESAIIAALITAGIMGLAVEVTITEGAAAGAASIGMSIGMSEGISNPSGGGSESGGKNFNKEIEKELHTHSYGIMWKSNQICHWHQCSCGARAGMMVHGFGEWTVTKPATENEEGARERRCVICGYKDSEKIPKTTHTHSYGSEWESDDTNHWHECSCGAKAEEAAHSFGEWVTIKSATEKEYGVKERSCVICGYKEIEIIFKTAHTHSYGSDWKTDGTNHWHECGCGAKAEEAAHSFGEWVTIKSATEDEYGIRERICVVCGYKETEVIPKTTHTHSYGSDWKTDGTNHWHECSNCGAKSEEAAHSFGEWTTIRSATEDEYGIKERICEICQYKETEVIPETTHTHSYGSDWKTDGTNHWHECGSCGAKSEEAAHSFGEWTTIKSATEDEYGIKERICEICQYKETEVIPETAHTHSYGSDWKTDRTNHWHECGCGAKAEEATHSFGEWATIRSATEDKYGIRERSCVVCGYREIGLIPKTTHTHSYGSDWKSDRTNHWHECSCGAKYEESTHSYGEWTVIKPATEDEYGIRERNCAVCGYKETEVIPETTHTHSCESDWKSDGTNHWHECSSCGGKVEEAAHSFGGWTATKPAAESEEGIRERICAVCGYKVIEAIPVTGGSSLPGTSAGKVDTDEQTDGKAPAIQISTSEKELEDILLTDAEKQQMANGTDVKIVLDVKDTSGSVSSQDKTKVEGALNGYIAGQYLDISLHKLIGENRIDITETAGKIIITIAVPDSLKNTDSKVTRTFAVIRVHDGVAELLPDLDNNVDTITIATDRFSTYTIVYKDTENGENKGVNNNRDKGENNDNNGADLPQTKDKAPETGDRTLSEWYVTLAMIAGFAYLILYFSKRRRGKTEETKKEMSD